MLKTLTPKTKIHRVAVFIYGWAQSLFHDLQLDDIGLELLGGLLLPLINLEVEASLRWPVIEVEKNLVMDEFLAVASNRGDGKGMSLVELVVDVLLVSNDGVLWTSYDTAPIVKIYDVCFGNGDFVAVGPLGARLGTADGLSWNVVPPITLRGPNGVAYGNGRFVAVGDNGTVLVSTVDALRPTSESPSLDDEGRFQFHLSAAIGKEVIIQVSTNLIDWGEWRRHQSSGTLEQFVDTQSTNYPARFYRAIQP